MEDQKAAVEDHSSLPSKEDLRNVMNNYIASLEPKLKSLNKLVRASPMFQESQTLAANRCNGRSTRILNLHTKSTLHMMQSVPYWKASVIM